MSTSTNSRPEPDCSFPLERGEFPSTSVGGAPPFFVVGGGPEPEAQRLSALVSPEAVVIAADGGWRLCQQQGWPTRLLVGDMDTLSPAEVDQAVASGVVLERHPAAKDQSDLELALWGAHRLGAKRLTCLGALGGHWDHCLSNLLAPLSLCHRLGIWARLATWGTEIYLLCPGVFRLRAPLGTRVSLAALSSQARGLTLEGFEYPLTRASLSRCQTRGVANRLARPQARIALEEGEVLLTLVWEADSSPHLLHALDKEDPGEL